MSQADIQRFVSDLKENQTLLDEVKSGALGLGAVVELAQAKGYDITVDEAKAYIREQANQDLSDEQLDAVAGGKGHHKSVATSQFAVQTSDVVTSVAEAAEVVTSAVQAAEAATTAAAGAEVAVVAIAVVVAT